MKPLAAAYLAACVAMCMAMAGSQVNASQPGSVRAPDPRDNVLLSACGSGGQALHDVARSVASRSLHRAPAWTMVELGQRLRALGEPHPGARAWTLRGPSIDRGLALDRLQVWLESLASQTENVSRRCGVASIEDSERGEAIAVVAVPVHADFVAPFPRSTEQGRWMTVDAVVHEQATGGKVMILDPRGAPRSVPTSFDQATGRVLGRFMVDREGPWLVQVIATTAMGPKPVIEAQVLVGDSKVASSQSVPGEFSGDGLPDKQAVLAMLNEARVSNGLRPLVQDLVADQVAMEHVKRMITAGLVAHDVGDGLPPERAAWAGISSSEVGENVSRAANAVLVHRALWGSLSHRANMLHPRYERVGVAAVRDGHGVLWVVQLFVGR